MAEIIAEGGSGIIQGAVRNGAEEGKLLMIKERIVKKSDRAAATK